ncbi:MAG: Uma2 family endonuclease [Chloroflexota bacterium]
MSALPQFDHPTETDYMAFERQSDEKHEFINGEIVAMSGASLAHIRISVNLANLLDNALTGTGCEVFNADMRVKIAAATSYTYPDASVTCDEPSLLPDDNAATLLNPPVIVEVLSPSTANFDRTTKFDLYQQIPSLRDYVLVVQEKPQIDCYSRGKNNTWLLKRVTGMDASITIPSLSRSLALRDVYSRVSFDEPTTPNTG